MARIDRLAPEWRALVHEYGWIIICHMRAEGRGDMAAVRDELEAWRVRRQEQWLAEIPYQRR